MGFVMRIAAVLLGLAAAQPLLARTGPVKVQATRTSSARRSRRRPRCLQKRDRGPWHQAGGGHPSQAGFRALVELGATGRAWIKLSGYVKF